MKKLLTAILVTLSAVCCALGLSACDFLNGEPQKEKVYVDVSSAYINDSGELVVRYEDNTEKNLGAFNANGKTPVSVEIVDGYFVITFSDSSRIMYNEANTEEIELPPCGHDWGEWTTVSKTTCESDGYSKRECSLCGNTQFKVYEHTGHSWGDGTAITQATCSTSGFTRYTCSECGETKIEETAATGLHNFAGDVCTECRKTRSAILDAYYNGSYGYEFLKSMQDGERYVELYENIDCAVSEFHNNSSATCESVTYNESAYSVLKVDMCGLDISEAAKVWKIFRDDKPLYYWIDTTLLAEGVSLAVVVDGEFADGAKRMAENEKLYAAAGQLKAVADGETSAYMRAFAYHDGIIGAIDYAYESDGRTPSGELSAHSIRGVLNGTGAVCEGYARTFQLLLNMCGVENIIVTGASMNQNHAWNMVRLDNGKWYWYDLTWDDVSGGTGVDYTYFCKAGETFPDHVAGNSQSDDLGMYLYDLPAAADSEYVYGNKTLGNTFTVDSLSYIVTGYNAADLIRADVDGVVNIPESVTYNGVNYKIQGIKLQEGANINGRYDVFNEGATEINIPKSVIALDYNVFNKIFLKLKNINVHEDNPVFCSVDGVMFTKDMYTLVKYPAGSERTSYTIPEEVNCLGWHCIGVGVRVANLKTLVVGKNVNIVGAVAFTRDYPTHEMPVKNVTSGEWNIIFHSLGIGGEVIIDGENERFTVCDGAVYSKDLSVLYGAPVDTTIFKVADGAVKINYMAFSNLASGSVILYIPASLESIDDAAFLNVKIDKVYYAGSESEWERLIPPTAKYLQSCLSDAEIIYNYSADN